MVIDAHVELCVKKLIFFGKNQFRAKMKKNHPKSLDFADTGKLLMVLQCLVLAAVPCFNVRKWNCTFDNKK